MPQSEQKPEREPGWYWIKHIDSDNWFAACHFEAGYWRIGGTGDALWEPHDLTEIGPRILRPGDPDPRDAEIAELRASRDMWLKTYREAEGTINYWADRYEALEDELAALRDDARRVAEIRQAIADIESPQEAHILAAMVASYWPVIRSALDNELSRLDEARLRAAPDASDRETAMALITKLQGHPCDPTDDDIAPTAKTIAEVRRATVEQFLQELARRYNVRYAHAKAEGNTRTGACLRACCSEITNIESWLRALSPTAKEPSAASPSERGVMTDDYLIWWTNQSDCERITPLDIWPVYLANEFRSRSGRAGRGRLWVPVGIGIHEAEAKWDDGNWLCRIANDAGGIVIRARDVRCVQFLPGFVTTFEMTLPFDILNRPEVTEAVAWAIDNFYRR